MFDYKDSNYFTDYFNKLPDFEVVENFALSNEEGEENLYVGYVDVKNAMYPIRLRVEIPTTFPHNHLVFRTDSLFGYPHLIYAGKIEYGSWFCLNTPFGETVEGQLDLEVERLRGWIKLELVDGRPARIEDEKTQISLAVIDAYEFENLDEMNEFREDARLTLVGSFFDNPDNFQEKGIINCVRNESNLIYAVENNIDTNFKLPYIIVDQSPSIDCLKDFVKLKEFYKWNQSICEYLLPELKIPYNFQKYDSLISFMAQMYDDDRFFSVQKNICDHLSKTESVFPVRTRTELASNLTFGPPTEYLPTVIPDEWKEIAKEDVNKSFDLLREYVDEAEGMGISVSQYYETVVCGGEFGAPGKDIAAHISDRRLHFFAIGVKRSGLLKWYIFHTKNYDSTYSINRISYQHLFAENDTTINNICQFGFIPSTSVYKIHSQGLHYEEVERLEEEDYYGRGQFSPLVTGKKIAIIGCGAIGSMVAESLARSGVSHFGLYDDDLVEPGNICRSIYTTGDLGNSKVFALRKRLVTINPFVNINTINISGDFVSNRHDVNDCVRLENNKNTFHNGSFYGSINYNSQRAAIHEITQYDILIDCTASNEMLHFLSFAVPYKAIISLCITNHSNELVCATTANGNPFEIRKAYLAKLVQDTKNFYHKGSGCYSPTFLATNSDIASLVQLCMRDINVYLSEGNPMPSTIYSHTKRGILADRLVNYKLEGYDIFMTIPNETLLDAEEMDDTDTLNIGHIFGCYSADGKQIMVTHFVEKYCAHDKLADAIETSKGVIDYIGDYAYSGEEANTYKQESLYNIIWKAENDSINTNNPLLAVRNPDGKLSFFLYINNELVSFVKQGI